MNASSRSGTAIQPLRARIKVATRAAILEAAEAVFAEQGFHGAHMEQIAARAGVAVGTLYNYFDDRRHLLAALLDATGAELDVRLAETLQGKLPFDRRLERFLKVAVRHLDEHWRFFAILMEDELARGRDDAGGSEQRPALRELYLAAEKLCALGVRQGALRKPGAELLPALLVGSIYGLFRHQLFVERGAPIVGQVPLLSRFFLQGAGA